MLHTQGYTILVVDDDRALLRTLRRSLTAHGYQVLTATNGNEALPIIARQAPDLVLLDLVLPGMNGLEICQKVRTTSSLPISMLSIQDTEREKVKALDLGANDYVAKPFHMDEVLARIRVALRRIERLTPEKEPCYQAGPLTIDFILHTIQLNGKDLSLTPTEYDLLKIFVTYRGKLLTRKMLVEQLWPAQEYKREHSLHVYVARLRQKIEPIPERPRFILTIPGVGYCFHEIAEEDPSGLPPF